MTDTARQSLPSTRPDSPPFQILTFDGGGLKGLFAAALLAEVEKQLNVTLADHFDLVAGTSTGGLIALALGAGLRPAEIVDFYVDAGPRIFGAPRRLRRVWRPKHDPNGLRDALVSVFGDRDLASSKKRLVIPAYSLNLDDVHVFKTRHHERLTRDHPVLMVDVAMATTAAPTYLPASRLGHLRLIDGGVWANNPALVAVAEATSMLDVPLHRIRLLSLGTTEEVRNLSRRLADGGWLHWGRVGAASLLRAQALGSFHAAQHLVGKDRVTRIDCPVPQGAFRLDRLDADRIRGLAEARAAHVCPEIKTFMAHVAPTFTMHPLEGS